MKLPALKEIVDERKEKAIENLSTSFAKNRLPLEEYERLVEYINKIESERELVVVEKIVSEYSSGDPTAKSSAYDDDDDYRPSSSITHKPLSSNLTLLSSRSVNGPYKSGAQFLSLLGTQNIKVHMADLSKRRTSLNVVSILGDSVISVESGIRVVNNALPILGNSDVSQKVDRQARNDGPELVINGAALLGNISVKLLKE